MHNYNTKPQYISKLSSEYIAFSLKNEAKQDDFLRTLKVYNQSTGEVQSVKNNFMQKNRDDYLYFCFQSIYMQEHLDENMTAVFITCSLPSRYHPFISVRKNGKEVKSYPNKRFQDFNNGNKIFTRFFRTVYNDFKIDRERVSLQYQKVIEPHKTFVPHLHALVYVPTQYLDKFIAHVKKQIKNYGLGKQHKIEVIKDNKKASSYLLKYIRKNLDGTDKTTAHLINGWKKSNRIRVYTHSQASIPKYIFQRISRTLQLEVDKGQNVLEEIEKLCKISIRYREGNEVRYKSYSSHEYKYQVNINILVKTLPIVNDELMLFDLKNALVYEDFYMIMNKEYFNTRHFYMYINEFHEFDDFVSLEYINNDYFYKYSDKDLLSMWEEYLLYYHSKEKKIYMLEEFEMKNKSNILMYKKSDWSLHSYSKEHNKNINEKIVNSFSYINNCPLLCV